jgi:hypothetical protein
MVIDEFYFDLRDYFMFEIRVIKFSRLPPYRKSSPSHGIGSASRASFEIIRLFLDPDPLGRLWENT